jgi:hypothetical protein
MMIKIPSTFFATSRGGAVSLVHLHREKKLIESPWTDVMLFFNVEKVRRKNWRFTYAQNTAGFCKIWVLAWDFKKKANFFAENFVLNIDPRI